MDAGEGSGAEKEAKAAGEAIEGQKEGPPPGPRPGEGEAEGGLVEAPLEGKEVQVGGSEVF